MTDRLRERSTAAVFAWASALFATPPNLTWVAEHRRGAGAELLQSLQKEPHLAEAATAMLAALVEGDDERVLQRLSQAYALALEGAGGPASAAPYESAYVGSGQLYQAPTAEMQALLTAADLAPAQGFHEPPDHISVELALAAHWLSAGDEGARRMARRLADWTPRFADACARADQTGFWAGAARIVAALAGRERGADVGSLVGVNKTTNGDMLHVHS